MGVDKIVEKMKNQPNGIRPEEAHKVLEHYGYMFKRQRGSHSHYENIITIKLKAHLTKKIILLPIASEYDIGRLFEP